MKKSNSPIMRIRYDKDADAINITLLEGDFQCRVVRLTDDIALDFAPGEKLVNIEILNASHIGVIGEDASIRLYKVRAVTEGV
jgi:uncharacterized protein YuzE